MFSFCCPSATEAHLCVFTEALWEEEALLT